MAQRIGMKAILKSKQYQKIMGGGKEKVSETKVLDTLVGSSLP
jgi:hypothetical protein